MIQCYEQQLEVNLILLIKHSCLLQNEAVWNWWLLNYFALNQYQHHHHLLVFELLELLLRLQHEYYLFDLPILMESAQYQSVPMDLQV
jgi:hypothetical protein